MIHMVTGGSGSGKSAYAEDWIVRYSSRVPVGERSGKLYYVATMIPYGEETLKKIERHHRLRAEKGFHTMECYRDLQNLVIPDNTGILLECVSNLAANELYHEDGTMEEREKALEAVMGGIRHLARQTDCLAIVTNEVDSDIHGYSPETEQYRKLMGMVNQQIAELSDLVTEVVYGIPVCLKNDEESMEQF